MKTCAFTGHRPQNLPFGFNEEDERCIDLKKTLREQIINLIENEGVTHFISGMAIGVDMYAAEIGDTIRLFPHHLHGEGHFVAVLENEGTVSENYRGYCANGEEKPLAKGEAKAYLAGLQEFLGKIPADDAGRLFLFGEQLYLMPEHMPATRRLHVLRPGLHLGTVKKNRLEPAHALALAISPQEACHSWNLSVDEARAYLAGQTFPAEGEKGWYLITVDGYSLGWGKLAGSVMKNHYPKGLRKLL